MSRIEYLARIADIGEFIPLLAMDRLDALQQLTDVNLDSLYMESRSPRVVDTGGANSPYAYHVVKLRDGSYHFVEDDPKPRYEQADIEKVFVAVDII